MSALASCSAREDQDPPGPNRRGRIGLRRPATRRRAREGRLPRDRHRPRRAQDRGDRGRPLLHPRRVDRRRQGPARQRQARRDDRLCGRRGAGHHQHLRAHAAAEDEGPRHVLHRLGGGIDRRAPAPGPARLPRIDDLPRNDRGSRAAAARSDRAQSGPRFLPGLLARARRSRQPDVPDAQRAEGRRRPDAGVRASSPARSTGRPSRRSSRSARPASPRW